MARYRRTPHGLVPAPMKSNSEQMLRHGWSPERIKAADARRARRRAAEAVRKESMTPQQAERDGTVRNRIEVRDLESIERLDSECVAARAKREKERLAAKFRGEAAHAVIAPTAHLPFGFKI